MVSHWIRAAIGVVVLAATLHAQMVNDPTGALVVNGVTGTSPLAAEVTPGGTLALEVSGHASVPWVLVFAPDIEINATIYAPGVALDIGPSANVTILMNGTESPAINFWNAFANTGPLGHSQLVFPVSPQTPLGTIGALQVFLIDFTLPTLVKATAATKLNVRFPAPDLLISAPPALGGDEVMQVVAPGVSVTPSTAPSTFVYQDIGLRRHGQMEKNEGSALSPISTTFISDGGFYRRRPPTLHAPIWFDEDTHAPRIKTVWGDLYQIRDTTTGLFGFMLVNETTTRLLPATMRPGIGGTTNPWKAIVAVDGTFMAAVETVSGGADKVALIRLDATLWPTTGTEVRDVTPTVSAPTTIFSESLVLWNDVLFFTGQISTASVPLYRVDVASTATAAAVTLPLISTGNPANIVSKDLFVDEAHSTIYMRVTDLASPNNSAIQRITNIAPGAVLTITGLNAFSFSGATRVVVEFGRAHDGASGKFAVSPNTQKIAFVTRRASASAEEVMIEDVTTGVVTEVTDSTRFTSFATTAIGIDLAWASNDRLLFWYGISASQMDLYAFDVSTGATVDVTNTSHHVGNTLPFNLGSLSRIDPRGQVLLTDRLIIIRGGTGSAGSQTNLSCLNVLGVDLATLTTTNINGDEFPGATAAQTTGHPPAASPALAESGTIMWWVGTKPGLTHELFSYDTVGAFTAATPHVITPTTSNSRIFAMEPKPDGTGCWYSESFQNTNGGCAIFYAPLVGLKSVVVPANFTAEFTDIRAFPVGAVHEGFFVVHAYASGISAAPDVRSILACDTTTGIYADVTPPITSATPGFLIHMLGTHIP